MEPPEPPEPPSTTTPRIEDFLDQPSRSLSDWWWLWSEDRAFPIRSHRGLLGRLTVAFKRLLRPIVKTPLNDLWDRQRTFNLVLLELLHDERRLQRQQLDQLAGELRPEMAQLRHDVDQRLEVMTALVDRLEGYRIEGLEDVLRHNDALFSLLDQKVDRYRREGLELWGRLGTALARVEGGDTAALVRAHREQGYLELERRHRGTEEDIEERLAPYVRHLEGRGPVLDLGCGRGEALRLLNRHGIAARGIDSSAEMVAWCREKGLDAIEGELFEELERVAEASFGGVVSFHVIEHLPPTSLDRLVRLAWRALRPGGVLILETPNPMSVVVAARNFWLDPTHQRPIHPASLQLMCRLAGFEPVERLELRPFAREERLPEMALEEGSEEARELARQVNELRDRLDELLFGHQDYAVIAFKP